MGKPEMGELVITDDQYSFPEKNSQVLEKYHLVRSMSIRRSLLTVIIFYSSDTAQQTMSVRLINRSIGFVK